MSECMEKTINDGVRDGGSASGARVYTKEGNVGGSVATGGNGGSGSENRREKRQEWRRNQQEQLRELFRPGRGRRRRTWAWPPRSLQFM
jgi:hypothetical protein